ncbi:MAG: DUF2971 domain-containing protein [Sulfuritalea sp.]|nr:DUF2971 domain-containing protein [Sulfuritalea sp.]
MSRLDKLADPYEGSLTAKTIEGIDTFLRQHGSKVGWNELSEMYRRNQATTYVCCWHANEQESEAMWRLYCGYGSGVAIQTTYDHLVGAIEKEYEVYLGCVKYIDYDREWFPDANVFHPVMHKRLAFAHEKEVRLVSSPATSRTPSPGGCPEVVSIPWDSSARVERVYVDPYAPEYFFEAVQMIVEAVEPSLGSRLIWSQMKAAPLF